MAPDVGVRRITGETEKGSSFMEARLEIGGVGIRPLQKSR